jgi:outer membrane protein OmpA-like peptidoglycan-associated protein
LEFNLAQAHHYKYNFDEAKSHYEKSKGSYEKLKGEISANPKIKGKEKERKLAEADNLIKWSEKKMQECDNAKAMQAQPINASIENLGSAVNTEFPEYTPILGKDTATLYFTSRRTGTVGDKMDWQDDGYFEDVYSAKASGGKYGGVEALNINKKYHDAAAAISSDGKTIYLYHDDRKTKGDLYTAQWDENTKQWGEAKKLNDNINSKYQETSLCLSPDGNTMYFASDRPGGLGGLDIYKSQKEGNDWGKPVNVGEPINTPYDEDAPYVSLDNKTLYFSSIGHNTAGGFDLFKSAAEGDKWGKPENMGYPINSPEDDVHLTLTEDNKKAFYVSADEAGFGDKDIYVIAAPKMTLNKLDKNGLTITPPRPKIDTTAKIPPFNSEFQVLYDFDRSFLRPKSVTSCNNLLKYMQDNPDLRIELSGHTCDVGSKPYNQVLSEQRAKAVANYLIERGVDANRIEVKGYNFETPAVPNDGEPNRRLNRRAEFKVLDKE